jgi:hypothetical protein
MTEIRKSGKEITEELQMRLPRFRRLAHRAKCLKCGKEFHARESERKKYCNEICRRQYMAERFDRWIASPETIALPQNYDEFLTQEKLPCLVDGCNFEGHKLSLHMNLTHGVTEREFKKLAGFNLSSGITSLPLKKRNMKNGGGKGSKKRISKFRVLSRKFFRTMKKLKQHRETWKNKGVGLDEIKKRADEVVSRFKDRAIAAGAKEKTIMVLINGNMNLGKVKKDYLALEQREHQVKSHAMVWMKDGLRKQCAYCQKTFNSFTGKSYCSPACKCSKNRKRHPRPKISMVCGNCNRNFLGQKRNAGSGNTFCSTRCGRIKRWAKEGK